MATEAESESGAQTKKESYVRAILDGLRPAEAAERAGYSGPASPEARKLADTAQELEDLGVVDDEYVERLGERVEDTKQDLKKMYRQQRAAKLLVGECDG